MSKLTGNRFTIPYTGTITNAGANADLLELTAGSSVVRLLGMRLGQTSEVGDAAEEALQLSIIHMTGATSGNGTSVTPRPIPTGASAATFTAECNGATVASGGTDTILEYLAWNIRSSPLEIWWPYDFFPAINAGAKLVVRMDSTPADDITGQLTFFVMEGG